LFKNRTTFEKTLSLLQGSSWAFAIAGSMYTFLLFSPFGILTGLLVGFFIFLIGFFFVVIFEMAQIQIDKLEELKKQTKLLESIQNEKILHH
jgi:hypothetical protein